MKRLYSVLMLLLLLLCTGQALAPLTARADALSPGEWSVHDWYVVNSDGVCAYGYAYVGGDKEAKKDDERAVSKGTVVYVRSARDAYGITWYSCNKFVKKSEDYYWDSFDYLGYIDASFLSSFESYYGAPIPLDSDGFWTGEYPNSAPKETTPPAQYVNITIGYDDLDVVSNYDNSPLGGQYYGSLVSVTPTETENCSVVSVNTDSYGFFRDMTVSVECGKDFYIGGNASQYTYLDPAERDAGYVIGGLKDGYGGTFTVKGTTEKSGSSATVYTGGHYVKPVVTTAPPQTAPPQTTPPVTTALQTTTAAPQTTTTATTEATTVTETTMPVVTTAPVTTALQADTTENQTTQTAPVPQIDPKPNRRPGRNSDRTVLLLVGVGTLILAGSGMAVYFLTRHSGAKAQASGMIACPQCGTLVPQQAKFCKSCGQPLMPPEQNPWNGLHQ